MSEIEETYDVKEDRILQLLRKAQELIVEPQRFLGLISVIFTFFVLSGGMYVLLEGSEVVGGVLRIEYFYYPWVDGNGRPLDHVYHRKDTQMMILDYHGQYVIEWILVLSALILGSTGVFLIRYSSRYAYDVRRSSSLLILGWILAVIAIAAMMYLFGEKSFIFTESTVLS